MDRSPGRLTHGRHDADEDVAHEARTAGRGSLLRRVPGGTRRMGEPMVDTVGGSGRPNLIHPLSGIHAVTH